MKHEEPRQGGFGPSGVGQAPWQRADRVAVALVVLALAAVVLLHTVPSAVILRPAGLLRTVNLVFAVLGCFLVSALFAARFVRGRELHWLLLGAGALAYGAACFLAGASLAGEPAGVRITVENVAMAAAGILTLTGALVAVDVQADVRAARPAAVLVATYSAALALVTIVTWAALSGLIPPLFTEEAGSSPLRQAVLLMAVASFAVSVPLLLAAARARRSQPLRWVALGLALFAISFWAYTGTMSRWGLMEWAGSAALWLGIAYLVAAGTVELRRQAATTVPLEALQESEEKYRTLLDSMDEGFCIIEMLFDAQGQATDYRFLEVNPAFEKQLGLHGVEGKSVLDLIPDIEEQWFQTYGRVAMTGEPVRLVGESKPLQGWYEVYAFPFGPRSSNQVAVLFRNVTERIESEAALRLREEEFRAFFENAGVGAAQVTPDFRFQRVNDRLCAITGYSREELLGMSPLNLDHPDDREVDRARVQRLLDDPGYVYDVEKRFVRQDGQTIWVHVTAEMVRDPEGRPLHTVATTADITERKLLQQALYAEREMLQAIYDAIPVMLSIYDPYLKKIVVNKHVARVTGWTPEDTAETSIMELTYPDPDYRREVADYMQSLQPGYRDVVMATKGGERLDTRWANVLVQDGRQVGIGIDVTALKQEERRRERYTAIQAGTRRIFEQVMRVETEEELGSTVLDVALRVTGSKVGFVGEVRADGRLYDIAISDMGWGLCQMYDEAGQRRPPGAFVLHGLCGRVIADGASLIANDPPADPDSIGLPPAHPPLTSFLGVPLLVDGRTMGMLAVGNRPGGYGPEQQEDLEALAPAVVQALLKKRAEMSLLDRTEELEILDRVNHTLVGSVEMNEVLDAALGELRGLFGATAAAAWVVDRVAGPGGGDLACRYLVGRRPVFPGGLRLKAGQGLAGQVLASGRTLAVPDLVANAAYADKFDVPLGIEVRAVLLVPLKARESTIGVLALYDENARVFDPGRQALAESIAAAAAVAVQRAQLYEQARLDADVRATLLREVNHRVKNNLSAILGLIYAERRRLRQRDEQDYDRVLDDLAGRVHSLARVHAILSAGGWRPLNLADLARELVSMSATAVSEAVPGLTLEVTPGPICVTPEQAHHLALVIGELATNSAKYGRGAEGLHIRLDTEVDDEQVCLVYRDDGPGYPPAVLEGSGRSVGLWLVDSIVHTSLRGAWTVANDGGAVTEVRFPMAAEVNRGGANGG